MHIGAIGLFAVPSAIWGSTWLAIKYQLTDVAPEVSVSYRFALASAMLAAWCLATGRSLRFVLGRWTGGNECAAYCPLPSK